MQTPENSQNPVPERYRGFHLDSVCWGYRDQFERIIEGLFADGAIGSGKTETTERFFSLLRHADQSCYDHVLKEFLFALNRENRWMMDVPSVFADITETGHLLSSMKLCLGISFFRILGEGGFGDTPSKVRHLMTMIRRLMKIDGDLALALVRGYRTLLERLTPAEIEHFASQGITIHAGNAAAGCRFLSTQSPAAESAILTLTREARLQDLSPLIANLLRSLTERDIHIGDLGQLDSDDLIERNSRMICLPTHLYLPLRIRHFDSSVRNRDWYRLCAITAAATLNSDSFPVLHGLPGFRDCTGLVGTSPSSVNLFIVLEIVRAVQWAKTHWPGARKLLDWGFETEFRERPPECAAEALLRESILDPARSESAKILLSEAGRIINAFDAANAINEIPLREIAETLPELGARYIRAFAFLPDFLFPTELSAPPSDSLVADLRNAAEKRRRKNDPSETDPEKIANTDESGKAEPEETNSESALPARFWYPEWNQTEAVYQENWCGVGEIHPKETRENTIPDNLREQAKRVQRIFERLRPEITRTERRLEDGDSITFERLVQYRVNRRLEPEPKVDFYEKPMILRRDLAVLILLDVSGSTADTAGSGKVIELEKNAAVILGEGLHALGDRFAVCGFSSNGRENCEFHRYKNFPDPWNPTSIGRILAAFPSNSTRMGAALRHAGEILFKIEAKQRLILLVTDGKPMDSGYDPHTRYAQHDVRMACEENLRKSIATFAISTEENSLADMEIMFPQRRFAILPDIRRLPDVLPRLYVRITVS